jgi:cell volume regulation protein A
VVTLVAVLGAYFAADGLQASGFMAVFVFGIVLGNKDSLGFKMEEGEQRKLEEFVSTTAFIMRLFIFILLGAQVDFGLISQHLIGGVVVTIILMLIARPATVFLCALPDRRARWTFNEMLFMCWTRETGVIPAAIAGLLVGMKAPGAQLIASITFIAILMTILIQAPTTQWLGGKLGLLEKIAASVGTRLAQGSTWQAPHAPCVNAPRPSCAPRASTCSGTASATAGSGASSITLLTTGSVFSTSPSGTSKINSSCTCSSI